MTNEKFIFWFVGFKANKAAHKKRAHYAFIFAKSKGNQLSQILHLVETGQLKPIIDREFNFDQSQEALEYLEAGHARGKVIVIIKKGKA